MRAIKNLIRKATKALGVLGLYHLFWAWISDKIYGHPSRKLTVIGVTGTKGKSTVLEMINAGLEAAGKKTVLASSVRFKVGDETRQNSSGNTMPGRGFLQKLMAEGVNKGCGYALLEVVSEGVVQHRHRFINFDVAAFINIHPEHIEAHGSFENYRRAKVQFFTDVEKQSGKLATFFVNEEDPNAAHFIEAVDEEKVVLTKKTSKFLRMQGDFNLENAGLAEGVLRSLGVREDIIERIFASFTGVPGRMEYVQENPFKVVVDYAHTPDSLEEVYKYLRKDARKLICVLGSAGGGRDRWKRPKMGAIADQYCNKIFLTDEDPFDEEPAQILEEISSGIPEDGMEKVDQILDRRQAIKEALSLADKGDTVVITGKGSEPYIRVANGKRIPWSDVGVVKELLER